MGILSGIIGLGTGIAGMVQKKKAYSDMQLARDEAIIDRDRAIKQSQLNRITVGDGVTNMVNPYAMAYGGFNPARQLKTYDTGGSHATHPLGGIPIGIGPDGQMSTVEEGESSFNINGQKYVFSNRLQYSGMDLLPNNVKGDTYSDTAKNIDNMFANREDKYSIDTKKEFMQRLAMDQERVKAEMLERENKVEGQNQMWGGGWAGTTLMSGLNSISEKQSYDDIVKKVKTLQNTAGKDTNMIEPQNSLPDVSEDWLAREAMNPFEKAWDSTKKGISNVNDWMNKDSNAAKLASGLGLATQGIGIWANVAGKNELEKSAPVEAYRINPNMYQENLVNRQAIQREIANQSATSRKAMTETSGGDVGALMSNMSGIDNASMRASSQAMLESDIADSAEKARVQQGQAAIAQYNSQAQAKADIATAQDLAAYNTQRAMYQQGIAQNISSLGETMMNMALVNRAMKFKNQEVDLLGLTEGTKNR